MDIKETGKKLKPFAPVLSVALVTACVAGSLSGYEAPVYAATQDEGNRNHNDHFMGSQQKGLTGYTTGIQSYIVYDHSVDHNGSHDNCVNCVFKFSFWHKNILLLIMSYVLFVIIRGMCVSNINNRFISI